MHRPGCAFFRKAGAPPFRAVIQQQHKRLRLKLKAQDPRAHNTRRCTLQGDSLSSRSAWQTLSRPPKRRGWTWTHPAVGRRTWVLTRPARQLMISTTISTRPQSPRTRLSCPRMPSTEAHWEVKETRRLQRQSRLAQQLRSQASATGASRPPRASRRQARTVAPRMASCLTRRTSTTK